MAVWLRAEGKAPRILSQVTLHQARPSGVTEPGSNQTVGGGRAGRPCPWGSEQTEDALAPEQHSLTDSDAQHLSPYPLFIFHNSLTLTGSL